MKPELTIVDAVRIAREMAAKETGDYRAALTLLANLGEYHHGRQTRRGRARKERRNGRAGARPSLPANQPIN